MNALDLLLLLVSIPTGAAYVCRFDPLRFSVHRWSVIGLHVALFGAMTIGAGHAWQGAAGLGDVCAIAGAALWIWVSFPSWRHGVPPYVARHPSGAPAEIGPVNWREIFGGCKR